MAHNALLAWEGVSKSYTQPHGDPLRLLNACDFQIHPQESISLVGPSGSGKSTCLYLCGWLENPDQGKVLWKGHDVARWSEKEKSQHRLDNIGFVYQHHHLLSDLTVLENVMVPWMVQKKINKTVRDRAMILLDDMGMVSRAEAMPHQLSGGEQQRVAIARALITEPALVLADEPTGNLDLALAQNIFDHLQKVSRHRGASLLVVTHNPELAHQCDRAMMLHEGKLLASTDH